MIRHAREADQRLQGLPLRLPQIAQRRRELRRVRLGKSRGIARRIEPARATRVFHHILRLIEALHRIAQLIERRLDIAVRAQPVVYRIERGADDVGVALLLADEFERRRRIGKFGRQFEARHQDGRDESETEYRRRYRERPGRKTREKIRAWPYRHESRSPFWPARRDCVAIGPLMASKASRTWAADG